MSYQKLQLQNNSGQLNDTLNTVSNPAKKANEVFKNSVSASNHNFSNVPVFPAIQPKLTINQPNDIYEQQADAMANKITKAGSETNDEHATHASVTSSTGGLPLPPQTRYFMERRFGADFSAVRVHNNNNAAELNKSMHARAFTYGNNIYFNNGQFTPESKEGKKLLAHELTHVVQQKPASTGSRETNITARHGNVIQRSLLGGILGGLGGALGGAVLGGLIGGPIGAVIGGVAGLIGGALIGDSVSTKSRALTSAEIVYAKEIFRDSIDYSEIKITRDGMLSAGAPRTIGNTINLKSDWGHFVGDTMELTQVGKETLIHEMGHVWQYQNGGLAYIPESLIAQLKVSISGQSRNAAYDWRAADAAKIPWEDWNPEQQAESIEDYNKLLRKSKDGTATVKELADLSTLLKYMQKVWNREGAPTFKTGDPANAPF